MALILYVEDHPPARLLMNAIVQEMTDYEIISVGSAAEAHHLINTHTPDLYILDLDLPDGDGVSLAQELQQRHHAPVLLVSAYAEAVDATANYEYLPKPLDPDDVETILRRTLG